MKKILFVSFLIVSLVLTSIIPSAVFADDEENTEPTRVINLVYDDSGSMIRTDDGEKVDTWCQAKYAMEVFAAMLGEKDTMNVYYMSDFQSGTNGKPKLRLKGEDGARDNISAVHDMVTNAGNTPFDAVRKAKSDLEKAKADEKWLVILTDGQFEDGALPQKEIEKTLKKKPEDMKIMFFGMGPSAGEINANEDDGIYYFKAKTNDLILDKLTDIGKQVFNRNQLPNENINSNVITFDIPMSELIVFAQGKDVTINGIKGKDGTEFSSIEEPVKVQYSEKASENIKNGSPDKSLQGQIATFQGDFTEGDYTLDISNAKKINVYYRPNIAVNATLTNEKGKQISNGKSVKEGTYKIHYSLVKNGTQNDKKPVPVKEDSKLFGEDGVRYSSDLVTDGETIQSEGQDQDIQLREGPLDILAKADYLKYYQIRTLLHYDSYTDKEITFEEVKNPEYPLTKEGLDSKAEGPIVLALKINGDAPSAEQWNELKDNSLKAELVKDSRFIEFDIKKGSKDGEYELIPSVPKKRVKKLRNTELDGHDFKVSLNHKLKSGEKWETTGDNRFKLHVDDKRNIWDKWGDLILKIGGILFLLLLILSETVFKARFKRSMQKEPKVNHKPSDYTLEKKTTRGNFSINFLSRIVPFQAERGVLSFKGAPSFYLKAIRGTSNMRLVNARAFVKKDNIRFDGQKITEEEAKKYNINPSTKIVVTKGDWKYECIPSQPYTAKK